MLLFVLCLKCFFFNSFISRPPPKIPEIHVKEEHFILIASALRNELNQAFVILRSIALGRDLKKFLMVCIFVQLRMCLS